jgi:hypothetical protein
LFEQHFVIGLRVGVAAQDQGAAVGGGEVSVHARADATGHKDVLLDPTLELVKNWAQHQVVFEILKGRFDFDQLNIELPELGWLASTQVGAMLWDHGTLRV